MEISFTTRFSNVMAIATAIRETDPALNADEVQAQAKSIEASIYDRATSEEEYESGCSTEVTSIEQSGHIDTRPDKSLEATLNRNGPDMGPFTKVTFHKDGLFSTMFKAAAEDIADDLPGTSLVALKVTTPSVMTPPHDSEREARILKDARSENVIPLLQSLWQPGGRYVLAFPFMPLDLATLMQGANLRKSNRSRIVRDTFNGISHLHSLGIIHRDIKPSNILLRSENGPAYLADFGTAWSPVDKASEASSNKITDVGTTSYRPPELLFGHTSYDTSLDLWAAGCTVAEMVRPGHSSLFDAGDLGSELALIKSIFSTLGTPDERIWPSVKKFPDWGKMRFVDYSPKPWKVILEGVFDLSVSFISQLVVYEASARMTASEALKHPLFSTEA